MKCFSSGKAKTYIVEAVIFSRFSLQGLYRQDSDKCLVAASAEVLLMLKFETEREKDS